MLHVRIEVSVIALCLDPVGESCLRLMHRRKLDHIEGWVKVAQQNLWVDLVIGYSKVQSDLSPERNDSIHYMRNLGETKRIAVKHIQAFQLIGRVDTYLKTSITVVQTVLDSHPGMDEYLQPFVPPRHHSRYHRMNVVIIIHVRMKPLSAVKHIGIPGWFSHAREVNIQTLGLSNLGMKMYSFQDLAGKIKERCVPARANLRDVTECASHGAAILGGDCHHPLLR